MNEAVDLGKSDNSWLETSVSWSVRTSTTGGPSATRGAVALLLVRTDWRPFGKPYRMCNRVWQSDGAEDVAAGVYSFNGRYISEEHTVSILGRQYR